MESMKNFNLDDLTSDLFILFILFCLTVTPSFADSETQKKVPLIVLEKAVMCEFIDNFKPLNQAVVFSISQGEVFCYSNFDPVQDKTVIYHKWYKKDKLIFTMRLTLSPPKWASFSSIKIRNADKGPWRVEIRDVDETLLKTLRFSMVD